MKDCYIPGLSVSMVANYTIQMTRHFGYANKEKKINSATDILFNVESISKLVTVTALMQLWEQGKFKLDDDINDYLPFKVINPNFNTTKITFLMLMTHTSSIVDS